MGDATLVHDDGPADHRSQRAQLVGDEQHRSAVGDEVAQRAGERLLAGRVHPGGGLVEDQQLRLAGQGAGDQGALLLAAGERGHRVAGPVGEPDRAQRGVDGGPVGSTRRAEHPPAGQPAGGHHLADGGRYAAAGAQALRDVPDAAPTAGTGATAGRRG